MNMKILLLAVSLLMLSACGQNEPPEEYVTGFAHGISGYVVSEVASYTVSENILYEEPPKEPVPVEQPLNPYADIPFGYIAVNYIIYMNENFYRRPPFTYRELETAEWIVETLLQMGHAYENIQIQPFYLNDFIGAFGWNKDLMVRGGMFGDRTPRYYSQNVILTVPGQSEEIIIIGAHYDTVLYAGASDNASGVALLLESAHRMRYIKNYHTLVYVFFGAEEIGLLGSRHFVNELSDTKSENILFMLNADVLFEGSYLVYVAGVDYDDSRTRTDNDLTRLWDTIAQEKYYQYGIKLFPYPYGMYYWHSDHIPFFINGFPVIMLSGLDRLPPYSFTPRILHTERDCFEYIEASWPGKIEQNMWAFSIFLESVLLRTV